jgi:hypothetical protein
MQMIGYSTGSLARSDVRRAVSLLERRDTGAIELSALRTHELEPLLQSLPDLALERYSHVSVHAPSTFSAREEREITAALLPVARRGWLIILHPDTIHDVSLWAAFGDRLCLENMDRRKHGRTVEELRPLFVRLPRASFCFDVAHARQCDTSMVEAYRLLSAFGDRLAQVHVSELDASSRHVRMTRSGVQACRMVSSLIPLSVPAIIEAPVRPEEIDAELVASLDALGRWASVARAA